MRFKQFLTVKFLVAVIGLPILVTAILFNSVYSPDGLRPIPIGIVDEDKSDFSRMVIERLKKEKSLKLLETSKSKAEKLVASNMLEASFVISKGFKEKIIEGNAAGVIKVIKNPGSIAAEMIGESISSIAARLLCSAAASDIVVREYANLGYNPSKNSKETWREAWAYTDAQWNQPVPLMKVDVQDINSEIPTDKVAKGQDFRVLWGVILAFLMFFLLLGAWFMADERRNGTIMRLRCSKISSLTVIAGNIIFLYFIGILQAGIVVLLYKFFWGIKELPVLQVFLILSSYILFTCSLTLIVSVYFAPIQLNFFVPIFSLITAVIGGCFWSIDILSEKVARLSLLTPQGWALKALNTAATGGSKIDSILSVIVGFSIISIVFVIFTNRKLKICI